MRTADLFGAEVASDSDGMLGRVHDVRLRVRGSLPEAPGRPALQVTGLVIGRGALGGRLGYGRGGRTGPWLLRIAFNRTARHARFVRWEDVLAVEPNRIRVRGKGEPLPAMERMP